MRKRCGRPRRLAPKGRAGIARCGGEGRASDDEVGGCCRPGPPRPRPAGALPPRRASHRIHVSVFGHCQASVEEELTAVKRTMAAMSQQHFHDLKRARGAAQQSPRAGAPPAAASPRGLAAAPAAPSPRGGGGGAGDSPVAAHRLEIQLHQQERQIAEQAAKIDAQVRSGDLVIS